MTDVQTLNQEVGEISGEVSSAIRAARSELLYPGNNSTPVDEMGKTLLVIANSIDFTNMMDQLEDKTVIDQYIDVTLPTLVAMHPNLLVRALAKRLLEVRGKGAPDVDLTPLIADQNAI
jgi:hypothetical protein